jgi:hypothetical protein
MSAQVSTATPQVALLPRLGPQPAGAAWVALALLLSAWVLLLPASASPFSSLPGDPDFPDVGGVVNYHWAVHTHGLVGITHSRLVGYPAIVDRLVLNGFPLDALASWPMVRLLGWPGGFTLYLVGTLWALGLSVAWLAGRWWRSPLAALAAGLVVQASGTVTHELQCGRSVHVFGFVFVPLALGLYLDAVRTGSARVGALAGLAAGASALAYWYFGFFVALPLGLAALLAARERFRVLRPTLAMLLALAALLALPLSYTLANLGDQPGMDLAFDSVVVRRGKEFPLVQLLDDLALQHKDILGGTWSLRPIALALIALGVARSRVRRWVLPARIRLPSGIEIPGAFALMLDIPILERLWWPTRALFLAALGSSLVLAGGLSWLEQRRGGRWIAGLTVVLLLVEATLLLPQLPLSRVPAPTAERLATYAAAQGPALVLPSPSGYLRNDSQILVDQVFHGRPLVNWVMHPDDSNAPQAVREAVRTSMLEGLYACERAPGGDQEDREATWDSLQRMGIQEVYLDMDFLGSQREALLDLYLACIVGHLGPPARRDPSFEVYRPPEAL